MTQHFDFVEVFRNLKLMSAKLIFIYMYLYIIRWNIIKHSNLWQQGCKLNPLPQWTCVFIDMQQACYLLPVTLRVKPGWTTDGQTDILRCHSYNPLCENGLITRLFPEIQFFVSVYWQIFSGKALELDYFKHKTCMYIIIN